MRKIFLPLKNITVIDQTLSIKSALKPQQEQEIDAMVSALVSTLPKAEVSHTVKNHIEPDAMFRISYGLFVLTAKDGKKDNGCIINAVNQLTDTPKRISISVNKMNDTHDMILKTGLFNLSVLTEDTPFKVFEHFGFQSGKETDKFKGVQDTARSLNGLLYLTQNTNAFLSCKVLNSIDCGTHTLFIAEVTEAMSLSSSPSVTYEYYFAHIKPKPQPTGEKKTGFICKICGYVYEGDTLPDDFVCPLCKHGAEDFEPLK